ncbi:MAG: hypothetical protein HY786_01155 [Deltaproteobacteria bacterium]|nr:hypothetical protein [Deltaproteobacteria bacterium]
MQKGIVLEKVEREIAGLPPQDQLRLVEMLAHKLRMSSQVIKKELDWSKLYGLGKGLWKGEDAQEYVNRLRKDRI